MKVHELETDKGAIIAIYKHGGIGAFGDYEYCAEWEDENGKHQRVGAGSIFTLKNIVRSRMAVVIF